MFKKQHIHRLIRQEECILKHVMVFQADISFSILSYYYIPEINAILKIDTRTYLHT